MLSTSQRACEIEYMLRPGECDVLPVRNPAVDLHAEARERIAAFAQRSAHTVEPLTISTRPLSSATRQAERVSLGKLSPPSFTAVTR